MQKKKGSTKNIINVWTAIILIMAVSLLLKLPEIFLIEKVEAATLNYAALRTNQSYASIINLKAGKSFTFSVEFKNVGLKNWAKGVVALKTLDGVKSEYYSTTWPSSTTSYIVKYGVTPKSVGTFKFVLTAPAYNGLRWERFKLYNGTEKIPGGDIEIGMNVYGGKTPEPEPVTPPENNNNSTALNDGHYWEIFPADYQVINDIKSAEPKIRVGLFYENSQKPYIYLPIKIKAINQGSYQLKIIDENSALLMQTQGEETTINFDFKTQRFLIIINGQTVATTDSPIKFVSTDPTKQLIFEISSWNHGPFWGMPCNDNQYRGELELKYNTLSDRLWMINELPIEDYMKGVAEVQDTYPYEALKAQKIAARTYAYTRILIPKYTNVADEDLPLFDLRSTQADQVYRGYLWEMRSPNISRAAEETRGMMAMYNNTPILAYYFARTDGHTRSSCAVGMTKECLPYLVAVDDPPGIGKKLLGHGVGMPQQSVFAAASNGALFHQVLRYYYRGIDIKKIW